MRGATWWMVLVLASCGDGGDDQPGPDGPIVDPDAPGDSPSDGAVVGPGVYRQTCDGSGAIVVDADHFADVNDEDQILRVYQRGVDGNPLQMFAMNSALGLGGTTEADLEDMELVGTRMFAITSHGRKTSGALDRARYKFAAFDLGGTVPNLTFTHVGTADLVLDQMLDANNWDTPNNAVITALTTASNLGDNSELTLAPEDMGTNIEAIASDGQGHLLIGFRNPRPNSKAIVVSFTNPDVTVTGSTAHFGTAGELDLGGLGIRSMTRTASRGILIVAGPHNSGGPFKLFKWTGAFADAPVFVSDLTAPVLAAPESVLEYSDGTVQVLFDEGDVETNNVICKDLAANARAFHDVTVAVP